MPCCICSRSAHDFGVALAIDDVRPHLAAHAGPGGSAAVGHLHRPGDARGRRHGRRRQAARWRPASCTPDEQTVTGRTLGDEIAAAPEPAGQEVIRPLERPLKPEGGLAILRGNLAPGGCVIKISGQKKTLHHGPARVFEREEDAFAAITGRADPGRTTSSSMRNEGPKGGPGMREMLARDRGALRAPGWARRVALVTDGRFSGATRGFVIGHVVPEAAARGPIAGLADGDVITHRRGTAPPRRRARRRRARPASHRLAGPESRHYETGVLAKYARLVGDASHGAITDAPEQRAVTPATARRVERSPGRRHVSVNVSITEMRSCWLPLPGTPCSTAWPRRHHLCPFGLKARDLLRRQGYTVDDHLLTTRGRRPSLQGRARREDHAADLHRRRARRRLRRSAPLLRQAGARTRRRPPTAR